MKLDIRTKEILKNFSRINESIAVDAGNTLQTITKTDSIFASATVPNSFEVPFAIYDLKKFHSVLSLMKDPELTFEEKYVVITEDNKSVKYYYCNRDHIVRPQFTGIPELNNDVSFSIKNEDIDDSLKSADVLRLPYLAFRGENGKLTFEALDMDNNVTNDRYVFEIASIDQDRDFCFYLKRDKFIMLGIDYDVIIDKEGMVRFKHNAVEYWICCESISYYN